MIMSTLADEALSSWDVLAWHYLLTAIGTIIEGIIVTQVATTLATCQIQKCSKIFEKKDTLNKGYLSARALL